MGIEYQYVKSSNIKGVAYDENQRILYVEFNNSSQYAYEDVPKEEYENLLGASSVGAYLNDYIKGQYTYRKI